jgi:hypothetical protein
LYLIAGLAQSVLLLREGENELVLAVVDAMGGCAFSAAFADMDGLTIRQPGR